MLAALPRTIVVSEAEPIDQVVQTDNAQWLRWIVHALGRRRTGQETHYFLKLDAWHTEKIPLFRAAFPDTPWIFVFRDPLEVLVSQVTKPGMLGVGKAARSRAEACASVLASICRSALVFRDDPKGMFVNYAQLPDAVWGKIAGHFGISLSEDELACMRSAGAIDAKSGGPTFEPDGDRKRRSATPEMLALTRELLEDPYQDLVGQAFQPAAGFQAGPRHSDHS